MDLNAHTHAHRGVSLGICVEGAGPRGEGGKQLYSNRPSEPSLCGYAALQRPGVGRKPTDPHLRESEREKKPEGEPERKRETERE